MRFIIVAACILIATPCFATNPDGPVGSMGFSFQWSNLATWNAEYSALGETFDAGELGFLDRGGNTIDLFARFPVLPYMTITGGYTHSGWSSLDEVTDDVGTFSLAGDGTNHYLSLGVRLYIPFTAAAKKELRSVSP